MNDGDGEMSDLLSAAVPLSRRDFLIRTGIGASAAMAAKNLLGEAPLHHSRRPNIILAMCDDLGWGDPGYNGNPTLITPNLDEMAKAGLRFTRFYSPAPVCSPARGGRLTGRHPFRYGIWYANAGHMRKQEITLATALKTQGYVTGHFGKWHLGTLTTKMQDGRRGGPGDTRDYSPPWENGFDVCFSTEVQVPTWDPMAEQPFSSKYWTGENQYATTDLEGDDSRVIMDRAVPFIRKAVSENKPFFAVIWFHTPHQLVRAGAAFRAMYPGRSEGEQEFYGVITAMDLQMGRLRKELKALGVADNTMLWFGSDHGPEGSTDDQSTNRGSSGPFRGRKRSLWEGGIRVPELLEWPGHTTPGSVTSVACSGLDCYPTILDALGFEMKDQPHPIDGISLLPLLEGRMTERPVPIPFATMGGVGNGASRGSPRYALVENRYKLLTDHPEQPGAAETDQMFDILNDPREITNIASQHPDQVNTMKEQLVKFQASYKRSLIGKDYSESFTPTPYDIPPYEPGFVRGKGGQNRINPAVRKQDAAG